MHPDLDHEFERQTKRLGSEIFNSVVVRGIGDIKRALQELNPATAVSDTTLLATQISGEDESGRKHNYNVQAKASSQTKRSILLEAFKILKERQSLTALTRSDIKPISVNGRMMQPPIKATTGYFWVDPLIKRWLGGRREGLFICWDLSDGLYKYDIFEHRLFKVSNEECKA